MPTGTAKDVETPQRGSLFPAVRPVALGDAGGVLVAAALAASLTLLVNEDPDRSSVSRT